MSKTLLIDLYELTMAQVYFKQKQDSLAVFDLFIRSQNRPFYIACGIDDALSALEDFTFHKEDIDYLRSLGLFEEEFISYLKNFKFNGDVWALDEPEIVFSAEPIIRVKANIIEAQIIESILLNKINLAVTLATKSARVVMAAKGKAVYDFSLRRTQGLEASLAAAKYSYISGAEGTSNVYAGFMYKIPVAGTMAHSFVMSFEREAESFLAFSKQYPAKSILLIDTYNVNEGIQNAIKISRYLRKLGCTLLGIRLDSGDLINDAKKVRALLDKDGLIDTCIFASGNLDEYKIDELIKKNAPIDAFGVGTNMGCSADLPFTDVIYKLVEIKEKNKNFIPAMKLSQNKSTLPGKKQIFRIYNSKGIMQKDIIALADEKNKGRKLLIKKIKAGVRLYKEKSINEKRKVLSEKIRLIPGGLKKLSTNEIYPVEISAKLSSLVQKVKKEMSSRSAKKIVVFDIDTQNDFLDKNGALYVRGSEKIIPNLERIISFAEKNGVMVISSQDTHCSDDPEFKEFGVHCVKNTNGCRKIKATRLKRCKIISQRKVYSLQELKLIKSKYRQIVLEKNTLDLFSNVNVLNLLEEILPDEIYICGVVTEYCIKEAIEGLLKYNFSAIIIEDAVKEISAGEKIKLFSSWKRRGIRFVKTDDFIDNPLFA